MERLLHLATEWVNLKVMAIVATLNPVAEAVQRVTQSIPIVIPFALEPVKFGLARSLARPGGNVTGVMQADPFAAKTMQLLKDTVRLVPRGASVLVRCGLLPAEQLPPDWTKSWLSQRQTRFRLIGRAQSESNEAD